MQLLNQAQLKKKFKPALHQIGGLHVLKLSGIEENDFYRTLGVYEGDVIMRVNDEWVNEAQNNLFNVLNSEDQVSIILMRKGMPVHLKYTIN